MEGAVDWEVAIVTVAFFLVGGGCCACAGRNTGFRCYCGCPLCYWKDSTRGGEEVGRVVRVGPAVCVSDGSF